MGNHEWCEICETADFHHGQPCDPKNVAAVKAERERRTDIKSKAVDRLRILAEDLKKQGWPAVVDENGHLVIHWYNTNV